MELKERLEKAIQDHPILLFTKGNKMFPRCGFSSRVIQIFQALEVPFETIDIFEDPDIKPTLVSITNWPTTPQVFIGGEFVGGGDVCWEMFQNGDLKTIVDQALEGGQS